MKKLFQTKRKIFKKILIDMGNNSCKLIIFSHGILIIPAEGKIKKLSNLLCNAEICC